MSLLSNDELNNLRYDKYFGEMELSEKQIAERIKTAEALEDTFLFLFSLVILMRKKGIKIDRVEIVDKVINKYIDSLKTDDIDVLSAYSYLLDHITVTVPEIVDTTLNNLTTEEDDEDTESDMQDSYLLSAMRVRFLSANESNSIHNNIDLYNAIKHGYKYKQWLTFKDDKVRHTHQLVDDVKIRVDDKFVVGGYLMDYPKDHNAGAEEIVNCRCVLQFSND